MAMSIALPFLPILQGFPAVAAANKYVSLLLSVPWLCLLHGHSLLPQQLYEKFLLAVAVS